VNIGRNAPIVPIQALRMQATQAFAPHDDVSAHIWNHAVALHRLRCLLCGCLMLGEVGVLRVLRIEKLLDENDEAEKRCSGPLTKFESGDGYGEANMAKG
jgi:hypothetical protein